MARRKRRKPAPELREETLNLPALTAERLSYWRARLGEMSIGSMVARMVRFYDRAASSVHGEGATIRLLHKDGKHEILDPEEV